MPLKAKTVNTNSILTRGRELKWEGVEGVREKKKDLITSGCFNLHGGCHGNISMKLTGVKPEHWPSNCLELSNRAKIAVYENTLCR